MTQLIETVGPHTVTVTAEAEQVAIPRHISYTVLIDGYLAEQEQEDTDNGRYSEADCAKFRMRDARELLEAGAYRRIGGKWQLAQNAEYPVPAGYCPEWPEDQADVQEGR